MALKFTAQREDIHQAVAAVQRATASRNIQPILGNILVEALVPGEPIILTATDLDLTIRTSLPAQILTPGRTTLSAKLLSEILAKLPGKTDVSFDAHDETSLVHLECGRAQFDIRTMDADEYPYIPKIEDVEGLDVDAKSLTRAISQTVFAAASFEANNVLGGVFFRLSPDALEMVATDGSRLARRLEAVSVSNIAEPVSAIIPARTLQEFTKLMGGHADGVVRVAIQDGQIFLSTERFHVVSRLLDGQYPKYEQLIPTSNKIIAQANKAELIASLERTAVMANERTNIIKMVWEPGQLNLTAQTPDIGDSKDQLSLTYEGDPLHIAFNYKFVLDALKVIETEDIRMETNGSLAPTIFRSADEGNYICLVMPVQVK
jgi:DNA polymerase-3 subunit beta